MDNDILNMPGEHVLTLQGLMGHVEGFVHVPPSCNRSNVVVIGHPHSLKSGTMTHKVVTVLVRLFSELGIPSIRFNFRGVGQSAGVYDAGVGESEDMLFIAQQWKAQYPESEVVYAGFSFGGYVACRAALQSQAKLLLTIAPPVKNFDFSAVLTQPMPTDLEWIMVQGDKDEVVPPHLVYDFVATLPKPPLLIRFPEACHFFHGQLITLKSSLSAAVSSAMFAS